MDQRYLAGVGNIYANEALFAAGIDPSKPARTAHARRPPPAARGDPAHPGGGDRVQRHHLPGLPHRHRRAGQLPARAAGLRARGGAVPSLRHPARRHPPDRRAHHRLLPPLPVVSPARRAQRVVPLPATDLEQLRQRVRALAENRPAVYRMLDATGRILYVGKAKRLRTRLLTYFRAGYPDDKAARILYAARDIAWDYVPSEFAALPRRAAADPEVPPALQPPGQPSPAGRVLIKVSGGPAPRVYAGGTVDPGRRALLRAVPIDGADAGGGADAQRPARPPRLRGRRCPSSSPARATCSTSRGRRRACATSSASAADPAPDS